MANAVAAGLWYRNEGHYGDLIFATVPILPETAEDHEREQARQRLRTSKRFRSQISMDY